MDLVHERTGYRAAIDAAPPGPGSPQSAGNIAVDLEAGTYVVLAHRSQAYQSLSREERARLRLNHFVTCSSPYARKARQA